MKELNPVVFISIVLLAGVLVVFGSAAEEVKETGEESQKVAIGNIQVTGNRNISSSEILSKVRSRVGQLFDPDMAAEDAKRIGGINGVEYCYYSTVVADGKIRLTFVVAEKGVIRSMVFDGNRSYKAGTLRGKLPFKVGDYLDSVLAGAAARTLTEFYRKEGFAFAQVALDSSQLSDGKVIYTVDEGPRVKIVSVKFSGNRAIKTGGLKKVLKTKKRKYVLWQGYLVEDRIEADIVKLQNIYHERSYLDAKVTVKREFSMDNSKVRITFEISEGEVYTVEKVDVSGVKHFKEEQVKSEFKVKEGQIYSELKANADVKQLLGRYRESGFVDAKVEHKRKFVSKGRLNAEFEVTEGERFRIGRIDITGNEQTQDRVVRRVLDEYDFQPGQWYNADMAHGDGSGELEKRVQRMVLAESAAITPGGEKLSQKDAMVSIIEGQTGMVMLGAGIGSNSGVIGQLVFSQQNFDIRDTPESFKEFITGQAFKGGGQNLRIALEPGTEVSEYSISFTEPYLKDKPTSLDVIGSSYERWRESYDEKRLKGYVGFEQRFRNRWRKSIGFRLENVDVASLDEDAPKEISDVKGGNAIAGVKFGAGKDTTDDIFNPGKGYIFSAGYEQAVGDHTFGILSATYRRYKTVYEDLAEQRTILGAKLHAATVIGSAPPFEKFYAGGQGSIRGFDYRGVSTRGLQTGVLDPKRKDPIGSNWIFLANAELAVPLVTEKFAALFFIDSGTIDSGNYRVSIGTGIQIQLPQWFGPVPMRFELAVPLMKGSEDETEVFSFSVGRLF